MGSQHIYIGRDLPVSHQSEAMMQEVLKEEGVPMVDEPFQVGQASVHLGWTFRPAGANSISDRDESW